MLLGACIWFCPTSATTKTVMLALTLFGPIVITREGEPVDRFRSQTEVALLVYLAHTGQTHTREALADLLWDASSTAQSLSNLRTVLSRLRKRVGDELVITRKTVALRSAKPSAVDSVRLQQDLLAIGNPKTPAEAAQLSAALTLHAEDFLAGFYLPGAPRFNDWVAVEQEKLRRQVFGGLERLISYALSEPDPPLGIAAARQWLAMDNLHETAHAHLIRLLALDGQTNAALAQYDQLVTILEDELGIAPSSKTMDLITRVGRGDVVPVSASNRSTQVVIPQNLPRELTPFIGRTVERAALVERLLDPGYPLITVTGEGGMGKTRLALAAARAIVAGDGLPAPVFPDGIWFVSLAAIDNQGPTRQTIAIAIGAAIGLSFYGDRPPSDQLLALLQAKSCLLVLDNFEHLLETDAPALVIDLLQAGPNVHLLTTSRAPLDLNSEFIVRLGGLPIPYGAASPKGKPVPGKAATYDSVRLFGERASRTGQPFDLADCVDDVAAICRYVAGVPLGIELAAAWIDRLSCTDIAASLATNVDFLATTKLDVPERQRSMRAVFDYSWALLNPEAQQALAEASVFRGGFDRDAATAVLGTHAEQLKYLVDHSLLERHSDGRYSLHELVREFAADKRMAADPIAEATDVRQRHGKYYLDLVGGQLRGANTEATITAARTDVDNVRKAWRWAVDGPHPAAVARSWQGLWTFYVRRGLFQEGLQSFDDAQRALELDAKDPDQQAAILRLQVARASLLNGLNRYDEAIMLAQELLQATDSQADPFLSAHARLIWGTALFRQGHHVEALTQLELGLIETQHADLGSLEADIRRRQGTALLELADLSQAREELQQALTIYREAGNRVGEAHILGDLGWLEQRSHQLTAARAYQTEALAIHRELDNRQGVTITLINLAGVCGMQRHFAEAIGFHREALANLEQIDDRYHRSLVNHGLGLELSRLGDYAQARGHYEQSMAIDEAIGDESGLTWSRNNLGLLYNHLEEYDTALTLHQEALSLSQKLHSPTTEGLAWSRIGQDLYGLGKFDESIAAFHAAMQIQTTLGQKIWRIESCAGKANALLDQNRPEEALALIETILPMLNDEALQGAREPFRIYWNCYRVLKTVQDPRSESVLTEARRELLQQAEAIPDDSLRASFLKNVPSHRRILAEDSR